MRMCCTANGCNKGGAHWAVMIECLVKLGIGLLLIIKTQLIFGWGECTFKQVRTNNQ